MNLIICKAKSKTLLCKMKIKFVKSLHGLKSLSFNFFFLFFFPDMTMIGAFMAAAYGKGKKIE